ncbi:chemotaxis protein CheW [Synechococcus sp. PCC 7336]|uniref:chemotaxis protein CheW n=1 Tax=Synechococcus sp. PCC 7336 TaxID=195250 RepID=UPI00034CB330|nr:chemotaxis protein CheW [Synechococcus sp. PCC 7336]
MAAISPIQQRRARTRQAVATRQVIAFPLRGEWFALPIESVRQVVPLGKVYDDPKGTGLSLTVCRNRELTVVDIGHRLFGDRPQTLPLQSSVKTSTRRVATTASLPDVLNLRNSTPPFPQATPTVGATAVATKSNDLASTQRFLIVIQSANGEQVGLPIDRPPAVKRIPIQTFVPIPATYAASDNVRCISSMMVQADGEPPMFAIDPEQLVAEVSSGLLASR